jgi:hypothetical protein
MLLRRRADISIGNTDGANALHLAASEGDLMGIEELSRHGGQLLLADKTSKGATALDLAAFNDHAACAKVLIRLGADVDARLISAKGELTNITPRRIIASSSVPEMQDLAVFLAQEFPPPRSRDPSDSGIAAQKDASESGHSLNSNAGVAEMQNRGSKAGDTAVRQTEREQPNLAQMLAAVLKHENAVIAALELSIRKPSFWSMRRVSSEHRHDVFRLAALSVVDHAVFYVAGGRQEQRDCIMDAILSTHVRLVRSGGAVNSLTVTSLPSRHCLRKLEQRWRAEVSLLSKTNLPSSVAPTDSTRSVRTFSIHRVTIMCSWFPTTRSLRQATLSCYSS